MWIHRRGLIWNAMPIFAWGTEKIFEISQAKWSLVWYFNQRLSENEAEILPILPLDSVLKIK